MALVDAVVAAALERRRRRQMLEERSTRPGLSDLSLKHMTCSARLNFVGKKVIGKNIAAGRPRLPGPTSRLQETRLGYRPNGLLHLRDTADLTGSYILTSRHVWKYLLYACFAASWRGSYIFNEYSGNPDNAVRKSAYLDPKMPCPTRPALLPPDAF